MLKRSCAVSLCVVGVGEMCACAPACVAIQQCARGLRAFGRRCCCLCLHAGGLEYVCVCVSVSVCVCVCVCVFVFV